MHFINQNKRYVAIIISAMILILLFFIPVASVSGDQTLAATYELSETQNISLLNAGSVVQTIKDKIGIAQMDTTGIDKSNPKDDTEKAILALDKIVIGIDFATFIFVLSVIAIILSAMIIYVRPNGKIGIVALAITPVLILLSALFAKSGVDTINENMALLGTYFGFDPAAQPVQLSLLPNFYCVVGLGVILFALNLILRKPKEANNEGEKLTRAIIAVCAGISVLSVAFITLFLLIKGIPTIGKIGFFEFIFGTEWKPTGDNPTFGIGNLILTSFAGTLGAVLIGVPIGILVAVCISQLTQKKVASVLSAAINLLAGIPSVIYGAVGAVLLVPFVQHTFNLATGATLFSAIIVLSIMVLPTIISVTTTSLNAVPVTYMEASLALGLTKEASIFKILIPAARSGVMTGVLLGLGRAIGEAMAIILVAGNVPGFPQLFKPARFLATGIVAEMGYATGLHRDALFAIGLVLFFFILIINSLFRYIIKKMGEKYE